MKKENISNVVLECLMFVEFASEHHLFIHAFLNITDITIFYLVSFCSLKIVAKIIEFIFLY